MNAKVEQILRKKTYDFAIMCGASEEEAKLEADQKIASVNKMVDQEKNQKLIDITTGKVVKFNNH